MKAKVLQCANRNKSQCRAHGNAHYSLKISEGLAGRDGLKPIVSLKKTKIHFLQTFIAWKKKGFFQMDSIMMASDVSFEGWTVLTG